MTTFQWVQLVVASGLAVYGVVTERFWLYVLAIVGNAAIIAWW